MCTIERPQFLFETDRTPYLKLLTASLLAATSLVPLSLRSQQLIVPLHLAYMMASGFGEDLSKTANITFISFESLKLINVALEILGLKLDSY